MTTAFLPGFVLSFSLILAIGAQNAFVLRQGVLRQHVFWVCLTCSVCDTALIIAGVAGFGRLGAAWPWFEPVMLYGGAAFLLWYGFVNFRSAWTGGSALVADHPDGVPSGQGLRQTILTLLALTWLNPHVYLDTLVLIGSVAVQYENRVAFGSGAALASMTFFFLLGYGARMLAPLFARPGAWRVLDLGVGVMMWGIAIKLLVF